MKRYFFILSLFVLGFSVNDVQREIIVLDWKFPESLDENSFSNGELTFPDAVYYPEESALPYFTKIYDLKDNQDFRIVAEDFEYEHLSLKNASAILKDLASETKVETQRIKSGNTYKLIVKILPVIKENNEILLLKKFSLKRIPVQIKSAKIESVDWANQSVLKSGKWLKIRTSGKAIYKIPYSTLSGWGFSNPAQVRVFGSGGTLLSEEPDKKEFDDLKQCAVWHAKNNGTDCLFFYEPGNVLWSPVDGENRFEHKNNDYSNKGYFFLTEDVGSIYVCDLTRHHS